IFLTGSTTGNAGGTNKGKEDAWVARFSDQGRLRWVKQIGSTQDDFSLAVTTDTKGNVAIAGYTQGDLSGANQGSQDAWIAKYRSDGTLIWKRQLGTNLPDRATSIAADATGNVFLGGTTDGNLGGTNLGLGFADAWTAKYSPTGKPIWRKQLGTNSIEYSDGVAVDNKGNVFLAGLTPLDIENP
ncbi:MAG TPA: SBBP repeat-containing protein, partial [Stenomitos sp.]